MLQPLYVCIYLYKMTCCSLYSPSIWYGHCDWVTWVSHKIYWHFVSTIDAPCSSYSCLNERKDISKLIELGAAVNLL